MGTTNLDILDVNGLKVGGYVVPSNTIDNLKYVTASYMEINQACDMSYRIENVTSSPYQFNSASDGKVIVLDKADGLAITLTAASGRGIRLKMYVKTTFTGECTIKVTGTDIMKGYAILGLDGGDTCSFFATAADTDTITFTATNTTGGIAGATIELVDIATGVWAVQVISDAAGVEATPFSATVS